MSGRRAGFGLMELLVIVLVVGIVARLAMPVYRWTEVRATATAAAEDLELIRTAAVSYNEEHDRWPADASRGIVPPELVPYLGESFSFERDHYGIDWDAWALPDGTPRAPDVGSLLGISLTTSDRAVGEALLELMGEEAVHYRIEDRYTFLIASG